MTIHDYSRHRLYVHLIATSWAARCRSIFACPMDSSPSTTVRSFQNHQFRDACLRSSTHKLLRICWSRFAWKTSVDLLGNAGSLLIPNLRYFSLRIWSFCLIDLVVWIRNSTFPWLRREAERDRRSGWPRNSVEPPSPSNDVCSVGMKRRSSLRRLRNLKCRNLDA